MGLIPKRVKKKDALWFYQIVLLICKVSKSGIVDNPRINYYTDVEGFTYKYAGTIRVASSCTHSFHTVKIQELVRFDSVLV